MASAILARRNETHWGEQKVYMRKNPNSNHTNWNRNPNPIPNPIPNPNPNPSKQKCSSPRKQIYDRPSQIHGGGSAATVAVKSDRKDSSSRGGYLSFNISACSRQELRGLKKRLMAELEIVRRLTSKIESIEFQSRSGYSATQFSSGGREVTSSSTRPTQNCSPEKQTPVAIVKAKAKNTKVSGSKRPNQELECGGGGGRDPKRLASDPVNSKTVSAMMKKCGVILSKLMKHKHGWIFNAPVDVVGMGLHDYNQIIKHPMDLGTVKSKIVKNLYHSPSDFASDVRLTFNNALKYNPKGHDVNVAAEQLLARFGELFEPEFRRYGSERQGTAAEELRRRSVVMAEEMEPRRSSWNHHSPKLHSPPPSVVTKSSSSAQALTERTAPAPAPLRLRLRPRLRPRPHQWRHQLLLLLSNWGADLGSHRRSRKRRTPTRGK
ncbi:hypothetical protein Sjap_018849 [Stephania japonica]|uniref:Bromo domain-containing protein n=1 Tax=Stephania japonica TaxID=461633 RepID=A0AAP0I8T2_9MAGN